MSQVPGWLRTSLAAGGVIGTVAVVFVIQAEFIGGRLNAGVIDPEFCSPSALHTTVELPETQFTRDFVTIRILLKDPADNFSRIRMLYEGKLQGPGAGHASAWLAKRGSRTGVRGSVAIAVTAMSEAERIDRLQGTTLAARIDDGLSRRDRLVVEAAFRDMFAVLLDELLLSIEKRFVDPAAPSRLFPHARRYYSEGLEAYLALQHPTESAIAGRSFAAMSRAVDEIKIGNEKAHEWFGRERRSFMQAIKIAIGDRQAVL